MGSKIPQERPETTAKPQVPPPPPPKRSSSAKKQLAKDVNNHVESAMNLTATDVMSDVKRLLLSWVDHGRLGVVWLHTEDVHQLFEWALHRARLRINFVLGSADIEIGHYDDTIPEPIHTQRMFICPDCEGSGSLMGMFPIYAEGESGPPVIELDCDRCNGRKEIPYAMLMWMAIGNQCRMVRLARGVGLREYSETNGLLPSDLSKIESGKVDPTKHAKQLGVL